LYVELQYVDSHTNGHSSDKNLGFDQWSDDVVLRKPAFEKIELDEGPGCKPFEGAENSRKNCCAWLRRDLYLKTY
jgi:hypothetical protein